MKLENILENILNTTKRALATGLLLGFGFGALAQAPIYQERMHPIKPHNVYINNALLTTGFTTLNALIKKQNVGRAILHGLIGSTLSTTGQHIVAQDKNWAWPAKLINSSGRAFTYSAMTGKLDHFALDIGPVDFSYNTTEDKFRARGLIAPTIHTIIKSIDNSSTFDLQQSLQYGTPIFTVEKFDNISYFSEVQGYTDANFAIYNKNYQDINGVVELQLSHALQYSARIPLGQLFLDKMHKDEDDTRPTYQGVNKYVGLDALFSHYTLDLMAGMFSTDYTKFQHVWSYSLTNLTPPPK